MEKALILLKDFEESFKDATIVQEGELERNGIAWILYVREAIAELEEAMKPKTCEKCSNWNVFCGKCDDHDNSLAGVDNYCCNRFEPKDNA